MNFEPKSTTFIHSIPKEIGMQIEKRGSYIQQMKKIRNQVVKSITKFSATQPIDVIIFLLELPFSGTEEWRSVAYFADFCRKRGEKIVSFE